MTKNTHDMKVKTSDAIYFYYYYLFYFINETELYFIHKYYYIYRMFSTYDTNNERALRNTSYDRIKPDGKMHSDSQRKY